jgi:hypothetical protein
MEEGARPVPRQSRAGRNGIPGPEVTQGRTCTTLRARALTRFHSRVAMPQPCRPFPGRLALRQEVGGTRSAVS